MASVLAVIAGMLGSFAVIFAIMFLGAVVRGYVLHKLWGWFVVTTFGAHPLGIAACLGLGLLLHYAVGVPPQLQEGLSSRQKRETMINQLGMPFLALLIGYVVHLFL